MASSYDAQELTRLAQELQSQTDEATTSHAILRHVLDMVNGAETASVTIRTRRHSFQTLAATSRTAETIDEAQYRLDEGPCVSSAEGVEWHRSGDLGADARWPNWGPIAAHHGIHSLLSISLQANGEPFGAINIYSGRMGAFDDREDVNVALLFGVHAANALTSARVISGLETALGSRHEIGMAQGILMERYGLTVTQSFAFLRRLSQNENRKLREVAQEIAIGQESTAATPGPAGEVSGLTAPTNPSSG